MGAVGAEELAQYDKMEEAAAVARGDGGGEKEKIFVSVRLRPLSEKEVDERDLCDWECINDTTVIFRNNLPERPMVPTAYTFDRVFRSDCITKQVYVEGAKDVALSVVSGINSTVFAYGQTSSGKTYTMTGITEYTAQDIYEYIHKHEERAFVLRFSAIEIYNEAVKDLLSTDSSPLRILDDPEKGTIVEKLTEVTLRDWNHLKALISVCEAHRKIGETSLNETSSRSHQILRLTVESCAQELFGKENSSTLVATVSFVDLAGSERASQALSVGNRLKEGCHINRSLLTLGSVIRKLSKGRTGHIPYRDSKLTRILQPSLGGNARTAIICTMSPARSHIEQSRNTLLFASCAKEVVTSAQVNVVMSDKALVKHLRKELARLESELRYSGVAPSVEALLREKDAQIKKMENHIKVLIQQRDIAESQLEDLLKVVGKDHSSGQWEPSETAPLNVPFLWDDLFSRSEPSDIADVSPDSAFSKCVTSCNQKHLQTGNNPFPSSRHTLRHLKFIGVNGNQGKEVAGEIVPENIEEICQEIHCVEVNGARRSEDLDSLLTEGSNSLQHHSIRSFDHVNRDEPEGHMDLGSLNTDPVTLEQHLQNVKKALTDLVKEYPDGSSPWSSSEDPSFRGFPYGRSRSCRSRLTNSSSWIQEDSTPPNISLREFPGRPEAFQRKLLSLNFEDDIKKQSTRGSQISVDRESLSALKLRNQEDSTPPNISLREFPGRPEAFQRKLLSLNFEDDIKKQSTRGSQISVDRESLSALKLRNPEAASGDMKRLDNCTKLEKMAQIHREKELLVDQRTKWEMIEGIGAECVAKDAVVEPSPCMWPQEFEKKQQEIIELWHDCNVPLVHRTCFYMLFTGDPTDSIYMEVELRRLSFLKNNLGNIDKTLATGASSTSSSSLRLLRRERGMLCKQMRKSLSAAERESIYAKWGIALDSKQRRLQLARRLWSETKDLDHVRESASIVARLIGLQKQGHALKEMFGLTFSPQKSNRRSFTWKHGYGK